MRNPPPQDEVDRLREKIRGVPVPASFGKAVEKIDVAYVTKRWEKLTERLGTDPEGAITSARTLLESVCLYILECPGKTLGAKGDLPTLYKATAETLGLDPKKGDDAAIKQVLGSCAGLAQGVATLRNQFGDAHGRLGEDAQRRIAHLAANGTGTPQRHINVDATQAGWLPSSWSQANEGRGKAALTQWETAKQ